MSHSFSLKFIHRKSTVKGCIVMAEKPTLKPTFQDIFCQTFPYRQVSTWWFCFTLSLWNKLIIIIITWSTLSSILLALWCSKHLASSTLLLKMENHSRTFVVPTHYMFSKSYFQHLEHMCSILPILKQNFIHNNAEAFALLGCYGTMLLSVYQHFSWLSAKVKQSRRILLGLLFPWRWNQ